MAKTIQLYYQDKKTFDFNERILQEIADLVTFTEEILNGKLHFLRTEALEQLSRGALKILYFPEIKI